MRSLRRILTVSSAANSPPSIHRTDETIGSASSRYAVHMMPAMSSGSNGGIDRSSPVSVENAWFPRWRFDTRESSRWSFCQDPYHPGDYCPSKTSRPICATRGLLFGFVLDDCERQKDKGERLLRNRYHL